MRYFSPAQNILFSGLYVIILIAFLGLLNWLIFFALDNVILDFLNWLNNLNIIVMIIVFVLSFSLVVGLVFNIVGIIAALVSAFVFQYFPYNNFTVMVSIILCVGNAIYDIVLLWKAPNHYSFWIVIELLVLTGIIWSLNTIALARDPNKV